MLPTAYVDACTTKFLFLRVFSCGPNLCKLRNYWEVSNGTDVPMQNGSLTRDIPSVEMLVDLLFLLCWRKLATIKQLMWPKPTIRLGLLPAHCQCGHARKLLVECTVPQYQLRRESHFWVLGGHFLPLMIGECWCCQLGLGGPWKACMLAGARRIGPSPNKKRSSRFCSNS